MSTLKTDSKYERTALYMLVLSVVASAFNYAFQIISGRLLSTADYGELNSAFSVINIFTVIGVALGLSTAKNISESSNIIGSKIKTLFLFCIIASIPFVSVLTVIMLLMNYSLSVSILTSTAIAFISLSYIFHGTLQGSKLFFKLSIFNIVQPLFKLLFGALLIALGMSFKVVFIVMAFGSLFSMLYGYLVLRNQNELSGSVDFKAIEPILKYLLFTLVSTSALTLFNNVDILIIRQYFSAEDVGIYSCAALFGKIILYIPAVLATMLFPIAVSGDSNSKSALKKTLFYSFLISAIAGIALYLFRNIAIRIVMGESYLSASKYILPLIAAILPLVMITVMVNYLIAREDKWFVSCACIISLLLIIVATHFMHKSIMLVLLELSVVYILLFSVLILRSFLKSE